MLSEYNERLNELRRQMARAGEAEAALRALYAQRDELTGRVGGLAKELQLEQADVDRLSGGFRAAYYAIIGKREELLDKERADVLAASEKYEAAKDELDRVQKEIDRLSWEEGSVKGLERQYREALARKLDAMKRLGIQTEKISELEGKKEYLAAQLRETDEAMQAGRRVVGRIEQIAKSLDSAESWGKWDLFGGGVISDIAKYSHLDDAERGAQGLEALLRTFRKELADITIHTDLNIRVDGFLRFADWFFDGFFADWAVLSRIQDSQQRLDQTRRQVQRTMEQLHRMEREMMKKREWLDGELLRLAEDA